MNAPRRCSGFSAPPFTRSVLFVGAERADEFADALRSMARGLDVTVVNPRWTVAATAFQDQGGRFVPLRIEQLPASIGPFGIICENYPYPSRRFSSARKFALPRLERLAPGGRWVLFTESPRFAAILKALADFDDRVACAFTLRSDSLPLPDAPSSRYVSRDTRFRLIFERRR